MRTRTIARMLAVAMGIATIALPAAAAHDRRGGTDLAYRLESATARLHDAADAVRHRGRFGHEASARLHRMDEWARYYRIAVERDGFGSWKARARYERFLREYGAATEVLEHLHPRWAGPELAMLRGTVARLNDAYGLYVAYDRRYDHDRYDRHDRRDPRYGDGGYVWYGRD
jgi:hypothetical protein